MKNLSIDFVLGLPNSPNEKEEACDSILVIVNEIKKMVSYKLVKIIINILGLRKMIIDLVIKYHSLPDSIVLNKDFLLSSKFCLLLCYFIGIKLILIKIKNSHQKIIKKNLKGL